MKATIILTALAAITFGPSDVLATPVNNERAPAPRHLKLQARKLDPRQLEARRLLTRKKKPKAQDESLKAWIDRGQDVQYYSEIKVGTPGQKFDVNFDTAADDLLIPTVACTTCDTQQWPHPLFDPAKSSTFLNDPGTSFEACFGTGGTSIPFDRFNPQCANITLAKDKVCIRDLCSPVQDIALGTGYDPAFMAQPFDGILGMNIENATSYNSWYWNVYQSGQLPSPEFAFYIEPREVHGSQITLGGVDKSKYKGDITTIPLSPIATHPNVQGWVLQVPALYVEGERVVNTTAPGIGSPLPYAEAKLDMATSFMGSPNFEATRDLYAIISPEIKELDPVLGIWGATCDVVNSVAKDVVFTVGAPGAQLNLTVPKADFNAGPLPGNETFCQAIYVNLGGARERANRNPGWVFGAPIFKNYYTVWNGRALTFGVARPKWKAASAP